MLVFALLTERRSARWVVLNLESVRIEEGVDMAKLSHVIKKPVVSVLVAVIFGGFALQGLAHHSAAIFDLEKEVALEGTVVKFQFTNPHVWIHVNVEDGEGNLVEWRIESVSPNMLKRKGWKRNSFKPGDKVSIKAHPTKDGQPKGAFIRAVLPDGKILGRKEE